jgi:hypothetical protein
MFKLIKSLFNRKTKLEQQLTMCDYLDSLQNNVLKGIK